MPNENTLPHEIQLDLVKEAHAVEQEIVVREGEKNSNQIRAHVTKDGKEFEIAEGAEVGIWLLTAAGNTKEQQCTYSGDTIEVTLNDDMLTDPGTCQVAYFQIELQGQVLTTEGFTLRITSGAATEGATGSYVEQLAQLTEAYRLAIEKVSAQENVRVQNELERIANENLRKKAEDRRGKQEKQREAAERKREQASHVAVQNAEDATSTANTAAGTANTAAQNADEATSKSEAQTQAAKEATDAATKATTKSEEQTALAKEATDAANAAKEASDAQTKLAEAATERADKAAEASETGEQARVEAEAQRVEAEQGREMAEQDRAAAETSRDEAEQARDTAEQLRAQADEDRTKRQATNDTQQAKNNADQDANNKAAQGLVWVELTEEQLGPDRVPTIEGEFGKLYFAPSENPAESDTAVEWMWKPGGDGVGRWERVGTSEVIPPSPIGTEKMDQIRSGEQLSGKGVMSEADLTYWYALDKDDADAQSKRDDGQDKAIEEAKKAGDDAAKDLASYKDTQSQTDSKQDEAIKKAQETADAAKSAIPPTVTSDDGGILPAYPAEGGPLYPVVKDGELLGWQAIPTFDATQAGLVPMAPEGDTKVLLSTGWGDYKGGGMPDYRGLKASIAAAKKAKADAKVAGSEDYDFGTEVATLQAMSDLEAAIGEAQAVYDAFDDPGTTQDMLDAAQAAMDEALEAFTSGIAPLQPDRSGLEEQEDRYDDLKGGVVTSTDGKDVPFGSMWVTSAEQQAADTALQAARTAVQAAKRQSEITSAVSTLDSALDTYESARKTATKDTAALDRAIEAANTAKADVKTSDSEGSDLPSGSQYVTSAEMKALTDAISAAQGAKASASTQTAIDKATSDLTSATSTFSSQVKTNWSAPENLQGASADDLARICDLAKEDGDTYYQKYKGQTFTIAMQNTTYSASTITVRCDDAANMDAVAGGKCGLHFTIIEGLKVQQMNTSRTTSGGYQGSNFYTKILPEIIKALPQEFQDRLEDLYVDVNLQSSGSTITPVPGKMHLITMNQWFGQANLQTSGLLSTASWWPNEETWLKWNQENDAPANRIIKNDSSAASTAWTCSVYNTTHFGLVISSGNPYSYYADSTRVPALGFSLTNG